MLIDGEGKVRLVDFGLAAVAASIEGAAARVGTPGYMAPEQLAGEKATRQSDVWSLGLVLFELFTGRPAFEARNLEDLQRLHAESKPSASAFLPGLDPTVERVLQRCLERDMVQRPASAREVSAALPGGRSLGGSHRGGGDTLA